jgi:hypothetical protein
MKNGVTTPERQVRADVFGQHRPQSIVGRVFGAECEPLIEPAEERLRPFVGAPAIRVGALKVGKEATDRLGAAGGDLKSCGAGAPPLVVGQMLEVWRAAEDGHRADHLAGLDGGVERERV